jgi:molybdopterin-synthase adenylyltransferase
MLNVTSTQVADQKVRLQDTARLFFIDANTIINRSGRSIIIEDEDGFVHAALTALDGTCSVARAYARIPASLQAAYSFDMMLDVIQQLDELKLLENVSRLEQDAKLLPDYDMVRWNRNFEFFNAYCSIHQSKFEVQQRIRRAKVVLLGIGGVGTHALLDLVSLGFTNIAALDFDKIEISNLNRQILYAESDVGRKKIEAARDAIARYIEPARHNITFHDLLLVAKLGGEAVDLLAVEVKSERVALGFSQPSTALFRCKCRPRPSARIRYSP